MNLMFSFGRYLFVSGGNSPAYIKRCGLDGSHCKMLVREHIERPISLVMDYTNGE